MSARCRVCHRELRSADAIAKGIGPVCEANAARLAGVRSADSAQARRQPEMTPERYARIQGALAMVGDLGIQAGKYLLDCVRYGTPEELAEAKRQDALIRHWYERVSRMEYRARKLLQQARYNAA